MDIAKEIARTAPKFVNTDLVRWGKIISVSPLQVRFSGDTSNTSIALANKSASISQSDFAVCVKAGAQWTLAYTLGSESSSTILSHNYYVGEYTSGLYYPNFAAPSLNSSDTADANYIYYTPFMANSDITIDQLFVASNTAASYRIGIYDDGANYPTNLIAQGESTGVNNPSVSINASLLANKLYWIAVVSSGSPSFQVASKSSSFDSVWVYRGASTVADVTSDSSNVGHWRQAHTYAALPDPFPDKATLSFDSVFSTFIRAGVRIA